jgi:hypothetical protein
MNKSKTREQNQNVIPKDPNTSNLNKKNLTFSNNLSSQQFDFFW